MTQQTLFDEPDPPPITEREKLDLVIASLEATRESLIEVARGIADELVTKNGVVTSVEVFKEMRLRGYGVQLDAVDPRWMGAVFRTGGWVRAGYRETGSHCRPVSVWKR